MNKCDYKLNKLIKYFLLNLYLVIFFDSPFAVASDYFYVVKTKDVFSHVLYGSGYTPIYGNKGYLLQIAQYNQIDIAKLDKIKPGEKINLPENIILHGFKNDFARFKNKDITSKEIIFKNSFQDQLVFNTNVATQEKLNDDSFIVRKVASQSDISQDALPSVEQKSDLYSNNKNFNQYSDFSFYIGTGYSRIDSEILQNGSKAAFLSKPNDVLGFNWQFHLEQDFTLFFGYQKNTIQFSDANRGLVFNDKINQTQIFLGGLFKNIIESINLAVELGNYERIFAPSYQAGTATLENHFISYSKLQVSKNFYNKQKIQIETGLGYSFLGSVESSNYSVDQGYAYSGFLKVNQNLSRYSIFLQSDLGFIFQNTSNSKKNEKFVTTVLGIKMPIGDDSK